MTEGKPHTLLPIGLIHTPFKTKKETPIQPSRSSEDGFVEVFPEFLPGLKSLEGFSHIILLYQFHESSGYNMEITPFLDERVHGLFATRYPARPNPIGMSIVKLVDKREDGLKVYGIDVLDGTPLLDIKPYIPRFDIVETDDENFRTGWHGEKMAEAKNQSPD